MAWEVEYTDQYGEWWDGLSDKEQDCMDFAVGLLEVRGPALGYPHSSTVNQSRHRHMRELRVQHAGRPFRVLYAFDPRRMAILLLGCVKTGNSRWYTENVPKADKLYDEHLLEISEENRNENT